MNKNEVETYWRSKLVPLEDETLEVISENVDEILADREEQREAEEMEDEDEEVEDEEVDPDTIKVI